MRLKELMKEYGATGIEGWTVPVSLLRHDPDNIRHDTPRLREANAELKESIRARGFLRPCTLTVRRSPDDEYMIVVNGNRRLAMVNELIAEGVDIRGLPCVPEPAGATDATRVIDRFVANQGLPNTPQEYWEGIQKLQSYGWDDADIAAKLGRSRTWLTNIIDLATAPSDVQAVIADGSVSPTQAVALIREHGADAAEIVKEAKAKTGKAHVTKKALDNVVQLRKRATPAPATDGNLALAVAPAPTLAEAAREVLRIWDRGELDADFDAAIAALRVAVG